MASYMCLRSTAGEKKGFKLVKNTPNCAGGGVGEKKLPRQGPSLSPKFYLAMLTSSVQKHFSHLYFVRCA